MKPNFDLKELAGITIYMISEMIQKLKANRKAMVAVYLAGALGVSLLIGGAVAYLGTYGADASVKAMPAETADPVESTPTAAIAPTQAVIVVDKPAGEWTEETCTQAGKQMDAEMASYWTSPQGTGCNVLSKGNWIALP